MIIIETWQHPTDCGIVVRDTISGDFSSLCIDSDEWCEVSRMRDNLDRNRLKEIAAMKLGQDYDGKNGLTLTIRSISPM